MPYGYFTTNNQNLQKLPFWLVTSKSPYLQELGEVFAQVNTLLTPGGRAVVNVANIRGDGGDVTTLAWDVAGTLSSVLRFEREVVICWDVDPPGFTQDYCLIFTRI